MRALVKQFLDSDISRRGFMREMATLGASLASAEALLSSISEAHAAEETGPQASREVTGFGHDLMMESLLEADVKYIFHGCGGGITSYFDAIVTRPEFKNFLATNEGQCVAMAEGYHIASGGELGVVIVPKPGIYNSGGNIHNAMANRSSLLVITARENNDWSERRGNIELIDWQDVLGPLMKWSYKIQHMNRITEFTRRAIKVARTPLGGPVFLQMTEDLFKQEGTGQILPQSKFQVAAKVRPDPDRIMDAARMLIEAENPLVAAGLEITKAGAVNELIELSELLGLPVTQGLSPFADFPNRHALSFGAFSRYTGYYRQADLFMALGAQMPDEGHYIVTGPPPPNAKTIHISLDPSLLSNFHPTELSIMADAKEAITDLIDAVKSLATKQRLETIRSERYERLTAIGQAERQRRIDRAKTKWDQAPITPARLTTELNDALEDDAIIVSEPSYGVPDWFDFGPDKKMAIGPSPGEVLGWATGAALGAKLAQPDKQVVAISGDGAFMFQNSLWSLARYDAPVIIVIYNNRAYNMNRAFGFLGDGAQATMKKDLVTYLGDPDVDFTYFAKAHGIGGEVVNDPANLKDAIKRAIQTTKDGKPYLLDVGTERWGAGGELTWHPEISISEMRTRKV